MDNNTNFTTIEEAFTRLAEINKQLEDPAVHLKESLALYTEGVNLVAKCKEELEGVEKEITRLNEV